MIVCSCPKCHFAISKEEFTQASRNWNILDPINLQCSSCGIDLRTTKLVIFLVWAMIAGCVAYWYIDGLASYVGLFIMGILFAALRIGLGVVVPR